LNSFAAAKIVTPRNVIGVGTRLRILPHLCVIASTAAILALAACASPRPHTHSPAVNSVSRVPGTVVLDPLNYERDKDRIKQALVRDSDSLAPTEVGYYMDVLQGRLKQLADKRMAVARHDDRIVLALTLSFESGGARIDSGSTEILTPLSRVLVEYRMTLVSVHIGADDDSAAGRPQLAEQRARVVAQHLVDAGVRRKRIVIAGAGVSRSPLASLENSTHVELQVEPIVRSIGTGR
jgi:outer membrane protein OmpA-like peptidoglycan-associated protein